MHFANFSFLTDRLQEAGFGQDLHETLQNILVDQPSSFEMPYKICFGKQVLEITVFVRKWKDADEGGGSLYYIRKYHAALSRENRVDPVEQDFYFGHSTPFVPIQQAYNLLCGRSVYRTNLTNKDKASYNSWVQLDFSQTDSKGNYKWQYYTDNYGYDLAGELLKFPILGLTAPGAENALVNSLQLGFREEVLMLVGGKEERYFIEALPKFKSLVICDSSESPLPREARMALIGPPEPVPQTERPKRKRIPIK